MKKRILYIGNNLTNSTFTATYISFFSKVLKEEGFEVKCASNKDNKISRLADMLFLIWKNKKNTDLVLIDTYGAQNFYYAYFSGKLCQQLQLPYIPILHGGNLSGRLRSSKKLSKSLFGNAKLNVAPSHFLYDIFKEEGFNNLKIIPNSIILSDYPFKKRIRFEPKLLWVRRFQERYNPMLTVKVYQELRKKYPRAELCMIGPEKDGSLRECKEFAQENNLPVEFPGKLKKKEWAQLAVNYDFFINSTNIDNTPISVIEAMALGLPVISTDVGGMPYLLEDDVDGILVPPENTDKMLQGIVNLVEDQGKAQQIALAAYQKAQTFDWKVVKKQWLEVL